MQLLWSERRSQMRWSGSGVDASRSGIASTELGRQLSQLQTPSSLRRTGERAAGVHAIEWPTHAHSTRQSVVALSELMCLVCGAVAGCCEHRYRRKWLYLRRACALPMRCGMRASCRCWCAPIECGPSAACTGELVTRLMCLVCAGTVAAALERMAQPDATEWLYCFRRSGIASTDSDGS